MGRSRGSGTLTAPLDFSITSIRGERGTTKNYGKLSNDDIAFINDGKERFGSPELENLYRRWRAGEITENAVRSDSLKFRTPSQVSIIFSTVNGQTALFDRHPHWAVNVAVKSSEEASFNGDFTSDFRPGWR